MVFAPRPAVKRRAGETPDTRTSASGLGPPGPGAAAALCPVVQPRDPDRRRVLPLAPGLSTSVNFAPAPAHVCADRCLQPPACFPEQMASGSPEEGGRRLTSLPGPERFGVPGEPRDGPDRVPRHRPDDRVDPPSGRSSARCLPRQSTHPRRPESLNCHPNSTAQSRSWIDPRRRFSSDSARRHTQIAVGALPAEFR